MKNRFIARADVFLVFSLLLSMAVCDVSQAPGEPASESTEALQAMGNVRDRLFIDGWRFSKSDDPSARNAEYDDTAWRTVDLPHDWSVESPFDPQLASCTAFLPGGIAWYRKHFEVPASAQGKSIGIRFDGISNHSTVWCNGQQVGERASGYSSFTCDLTPALRFGAANVIAVRVDHAKYADSRWYAGSGIYRNVYLSALDPVHIDTYGTFVETPNVTVDSADISVQIRLKNDQLAAANMTVVNRILDPSGQLATSLEQNTSVPAHGNQQVDMHGAVAHPALWSVEHPQMYTLQTQVKRGAAIVDEYRTPFGIRTFAFSPDKGFSLNGQGMKLKGICLHQDAGVLGVAVPIQVWRRRLKLLKDVGCNAIRSAHNPPAPEFLDLCDQMGFLVMDEAFDEWTGGKKKWITGHNVGKPGTDGYHSDFDRWADIDVRDMVLRDRNHPSIIMWSIGNEIDFENDPFPANSPQLPPIAERLIKDVKAVDTTRPITAACAFPESNQFKQLLDIEGYNYMERLYTSDHASHPNRVLYGSENSQNLAAWQAVSEHDYIAGQFLWTAFDFMGEAGTWPSHASASGMMTLAGFPKPGYFVRQSLWADGPMVYLSTNRIGRGRNLGSAVEKTVYCVTNCDSVELFHDGQSLGSKTHTVGEILQWPLDFQSGVVKAVGKKGSATATFELKKALDPAALALHPDVTSLQADGRDVCQIEVDVNDRQGVVVQDATNVVTCSIEGPARVLGIENGDVRTTDECQAMSRRAHQGRLLIYVQSGKNSGQVKVTVSSPSLDSASMVLDTR